MIVNVFSTKILFEGTILTSCTRDRTAILCGHSISPCNRNRIPESAKFLLVESWILSFEIGNVSQGIQNPTNVWNPKFKFYWQRLESSTCSPECTARGIQNPESINGKDSLSYVGRVRATRVFERQRQYLYISVLLTLSFLLLLSRKRLSRTWV